MIDHNVNRWKQSGMVYLWKYTENIRNFPGWHLSADRQGCASLIELINLMKRTKLPSERTIKITSPTKTVLSVPDNMSGGAKWLSIERLKIKSVKGFSNDDVWSLKHDHQKIYLTAGLNKLNDLLNGIIGISNGKGDYSIGHQKGSKISESTCLWFWW